MRLRRGSLGILVICLVWFTATRVGAIWQTEPASIASKNVERTVVSSNSRIFADLTSREIALLKRVDLRLRQNPLDYEASLLKGLLYFKAGDLHQALAQLDTLTHEAPRFQLAHLIKGDLLLARYDQVSDIGRNGILAHLDSRQQHQIESLREEAHARLQGYLSLIGNQRIPEELVTLGKDVKAALVVDKSKHRLYVFENGQPGLPPHLVGDYYCVIGKLPGNKHVQGDMKTPEGVYFLTCHISGSKLPDRYGDGAFPLSYPNALDRRDGKTGNGIWLHGTIGEVYSRPPLDSDGCVVLSNDNLDAVSRYVQPGQTPVVIAHQVHWINSEEWLSRNHALMKALQSWRQDWQNGHLAIYLRHYAPGFWSGRYDLRSWDRHKKAVLAGKSYQHITLSDVSILTYPARAADGKTLAVADFDQSYHSNNYNSDTRKRLYLVKNGSRWRILAELTP
ncbi:MAG TPA: L,D-transpeptidase family protein [Desulfuromonadales bacterium]|nr:L,D-transpeptidase family protein [Desulfuromonadales bacterium]